MKVELLQYTHEPEKTVALAAKLCYSSADIENIRDGLDDEKVKTFIEKLTDFGHESPFEHVSFTFGISGVSRTLLAQLTRHRIASYSVKSQRYVNEAQFTYITPPAILENETANDLYQKTMQKINETYNQLADILYQKHYDELIQTGMDEKKAKATAEKVAIEDARFILPNACETKIIMTMNARSLFNFFQLRCCERAQWEIRALAIKMLQLVKTIAPSIFKNAGPACICGSCPEGAMSCGKSAEKRVYFNTLTDQ